MTAPAVLVVEHVPWEGAHRIGDALERAGLRLDVRRPLQGDPLPAPGEVAGAVFMGGPMNVDDLERHPALGAERMWLTEAIADGLPVLGVCLGAQLIARALGATVTAGEQPEIGWYGIEALDPDDPLTGGLVPVTKVLHWHGDVFGLPPGATLLARSDQTPVQAFRAQNAWGLLFHAEADPELAGRWLDEPSMVEQARAAIGRGAEARILTGSVAYGTTLMQRSRPGFDAFAAEIKSRHGV